MWHPKQTQTFPNILNKPLCQRIIGLQQRGIIYLMPSVDGRTSLICLLVSILGGSYLIEQPGSSILPQYKRIVWLSRRLRVSWGPA